MTTLQPTATRQGQREIVAATLAAGMIAAEGKPVTVAEATQVMTEVLDEVSTPPARRERSAN